MKDKTKTQEKPEKRSIWGNSWANMRKWVYPAWLAYELSFRFADYANSVHNFLERSKPGISETIGDFGFQALDAIATHGTFAGCTLYLTLPAGLALYEFFNQDNLTHSKFERRLKKYL